MGRTRQHRGAQVIKAERPLRAARGVRHHGFGGRLLTHVGSATYPVTKHAAVAFGEYLGITYGERGVRVSVLCPQAVRTAMTQGLERDISSVDGMIEPEALADCVIDGLADERFLILPHPTVLEYLRRKAAEYDRWLRGMRRLKATHSAQ